MLLPEPEGLHLLFDKLLDQGLSTLTTSDLEQLDQELRRAGLDSVGKLLQEAWDDESNLAALVEAVGEARRTLAGHMSVVRLDAGVRGAKRDALLLALNRAAGADEPLPEPEGHLLRQLDQLPTYRAIPRITNCNDGPTLWCLVRSGRIAEQRAAAQRLGNLIADGTLIERDGLDSRTVASKLAALREPRIAFDVDMALAEMGGSSARAARQRRARAERLLAKVLGEARRYWAGESEHDPLTRLSREEALRLGVWLRLGDDDLAAHVGEYLRNLIGSAMDGRLADGVSLFIPSGDKRLVPTLCRVLADGPHNARIAAARAMGRFADPRIHQALAKAYRHTRDVMEQTVLAGALGQHGDRRGLPFVLEGMTQNEPELWEETVRSLGSIGAEEAGPKLVPLLESERPALVRAAGQALIRCGGREELHRLREVANKHPQFGGLLAQATEGLGLRLQLLGMLPDDGTLPPPPAQWHEPSLTPTRSTLEPTARDRLRGLFLFLSGLVWGLLSQRLRAIEAFSQAARLAPRAASPHLRQAFLHASLQRDDLAIDSFRRALRANVAAVLRRPRWVRRLLLVYLRRADGLVARRRKGAALSLLDEVAALDLRQGDLDLRLALARRRDRLVVDRARQRAARSEAES